jgi:alcohol dehydrogenase (NADP+)
VTPPLPVGLVGCGAVADRYAAGIAAASSLRLVGAADLQPERARRIADAHDCVAAVDLAGLLEEADPALVVNLTSHAAHAPVTREALAAGRHVFTEKPLALDGETARDLVALAAEEGVRLGCAPVSHAAPTARRVRRLLSEGRLGRVQLASATCHIGRIPEWHDDPGSFLAAGPLFDGAVYPLTVLASLFGPVETVRTADAETLLDSYDLPDGTLDVTSPDHVVATLAFRDGPTATLVASGYVPYRTREFMSLELHGDDGSAYVGDCGGLEAGGRERVQFARLGDEYGPVPVQPPANADLGPADGPAMLARALRDGRPSVVDAARAVHVTEVAEAVLRAAADGGPVDVAAPEPVVEPDPWPVRADPTGDALALPSVGFGCSRYRGDGEYVDLAGPIGWALDAGYRLFDTAELYGTETTLGAALDRPGRPDREAVTVVSKVWNTNHEPDRLRAACRRSLDRLGLDSLDAYLLHWPDAWAHQGHLEDVAAMAHEDLEALAFPTDGDGEPLAADVSRAETWAAMESLVERGWVDAPGVCNVDREWLGGLLAEASVPPALVQVESHPYEPRADLVEFCHDRGIRVLAHSPLSPPGLLSDPVVLEVAEACDATPAQVLLRWQVDRGVVPVPSSTDREHLVENADLGDVTLDADARASLDGLADPAFSRE